MPERDSLQKALGAVSSMMMSLGKASLGAQVLSPAGCQSTDVKPEASPSPGSCSQGKWEAEETPQCKQIPGLKVWQSAQVEQRFFQPAFSKCLLLPKPGKGPFPCLNSTAAILNVANPTCCSPSHTPGAFWHLTPPWNTPHCSTPGHGLMESCVGSDVINPTKVCHL